MKDYHIYKLVDPRTEEVKYIGMTSLSLEARRQQHIRDAGRFANGREVRNTTKQFWILDLLTLGLEPQIALIETIHGEQAAKGQEGITIQRYISLGSHLVNYQHTKRKPVEIELNFDSPDFDLVRSLNEELADVEKDYQHLPNIPIKEIDLIAATRLLFATEEEKEQIQRWYQQQIKGLEETPLPEHILNQFLSVASYYINEK